MKIEDQEYEYMAEICADVSNKIKKKLKKGMDKKILKSESIYLYLGLTLTMLIKGIFRQLEEITGISKDDITERFIEMLRVKNNER